jgi:hypothetical protein
MRNTQAARNLSLMRSAAIFLYELQRHRPKAKKSLPDWLRKNMRSPTFSSILLNGRFYFSRTGSPAL